MSEAIFQNIGGIALVFFALAIYLRFIYKNKPSGRFTSDMTVGDILIVYPGSRSTVTKPYYVEVLFYNPKALLGDVILTTSIPEKHSCHMIVGENWEYHRSRIALVGTRKKFGHLLLNQKFD